MVKWGKRLLGRNKASSRHRGGKKSDYYSRRRDYDYSDEDSSQGSYDEDYEEESAAWDGRDDDAGEYYDEEDNYRDGDEIDELVTRDQVLGELRAQAAAEALGKSLEQMGYNLDNCDSFYSLSDREDRTDQRYKVEQQERADILPTVKKSSSNTKKGKRSKSKKKKSKSLRSTGALSDDEDDASSYYENYSRANHHSFGDYETYNDSSSEESDSYYGDETTTFATGRESGITGKSSRFSRFTGKKSAKSRKSFKFQSRKKKKPVRDQDSYYSKGTEWSPGDSSYAKSLDRNSTLSSVSSSEEESETSDYTEPSRRRGRKAPARRPKNGKKKRNMDAIDEEDEDPNLSEDSSVKVEKVQKKKMAKKPPTMRRRSDSSRYSNSSQIGAMRSMDTLSDADSDSSNELAKEAGDTEGLSVAEETGEKGKKQKEKSTKPVGGRENRKLEEKKSKNRSRLRKVDETVSEEESSAESVAVDEASSSAELDSVEKTSTKKGKEKKSGDREDPSRRSDKKSVKRREVAKKSDMSASCASEPKSNRTGKHSGADKESKHERRKSSKQPREMPSDGSQIKEQKTKSTKKKKDKLEKISEKISEKINSDDKADGEGNQQAENGTVKQGKRFVTAADDASQAHASVSSKKFWPRQFLSLRKKKNDEIADAVKEAEDIHEEDDGQVNDNKDEAKEQSQPSVSEAKSLEADQESDADQGSDAEQESETEEVASTEREASPKSSKRRDPSPLRSQRSRKHARERHSENDMNESNRKASSKQDASIISPPFTHSEKEKDVHEKDATNEKGTSSSLGVLEMAAMAVMIPLAPLAAAYSCYTADRTQRLIADTATVVESACAPIEHKRISETKKERDGESHYTSSSSRKKRRSSQKKQEITSSIKKTADGDDQASIDDGKTAITESAKSTKSTTNPKEVVESSTVSSKPSKMSKSASKTSKASKASEAKSSRSKKGLTKILPQRLSKQETKDEAPQAEIQEEAEGFESFLPGSMDLQSLPTLDTIPKASQAQLQATESMPVPQKPQDPSIDSKGRQRKTKRWLPKLHFKKDKQEVNSFEATAKPTNDSQDAKEKVSRSVQRVPFLKVGQKEMREDIRAPSKRRTERVAAPDDEIIPFSCTKDSAMCGQVDETENDDMDRSLLSDFENIALDALRKKSQNEVKNKGAAFDPSKATHEDLLRYYNLEQTLSDVADARQTLEQAYGVRSGGNSFDHTIDEQLVELLTHMAEMDQDDVVEIEAAIQKLKRHARKLGISERELLFSVKSAEESVLSPTSGDGYRGKLDEPPSFSDKMIDAFEGYFQS